MKIQATKNSQFQPIKLEIIIESERELEALIALGNSSTSSLKDHINRNGALYAKIKEFEASELEIIQKFYYVLNGLR